MGAAVLVSDEGRYGIDRSIELLKAGAPALDAVEVGARAVEADSRARTVGFGGAPNAAGAMECDASVMDGTTMRCGAVGALQGFRSPIAVARQVMEQLPHVFLAGAGAARFAREIGAEVAEMLAPEAAAAYRTWAGDGASLESDAEPLLSRMTWTRRRNLSLGTVTFLVLDRNGNLGGGVSTAGWAYKYPGRLGDSPVIGAGIYVDGRYGGAACTHTGEMTIRAGTARAVIAYIKKGATLAEACFEAIDDLRHLSGGYLGPVIIHAMSPDGEPCVVKTGEVDRDGYQYWSESSGSILEGKALDESKELECGG